jgi:hypothetical protein
MLIFELCFKIVHLNYLVPLSILIASGLQKYLDAEKPYIWLFNGKIYGEPMATGVFNGL